MASKVFTPGVVIDSPWLNAVNRATYELLGDGTNVAGTKEEARSVLGIGSAISFRNKLINADGRVDQKGYGSSITANSNNFYFTDRWRIAASGETVNIQVLPSGSKQWTTGANGIEQVVEGNNVEAGVYVLSWTGNATASINYSPIPNGGSILLPANQHVVVRFVGTFTEPQFERGSRPTPFERRPFSVELDLAQRYFYSLDGNALYCLGQVMSPTYALGMLTLPTVMRTNPTFLANLVGTTNAGGGDVAANAASLASGNIRVVGVAFGFPAGSGLVAGNATVFKGLVANSFLRFDAEL